MTDNEPIVVPKTWIAKTLPVGHEENLENKPIVVLNESFFVDSSIIIDLVGQIAVVTTSEIYKKYLNDIRNAIKENPTEWLEVYKKMIIAHEQRHIKQEVELGVLSQVGTIGDHFSIVKVDILKELDALIAGFLNFTQPEILEGEFLKQMFVLPLFRLYEINTDDGLNRINNLSLGISKDELATRIFSYILLLNPNLNIDAALNNITKKDIDSAIANLESIIKGESGISSFVSTDRSEKIWNALSVV